MITLAVISQKGGSGKTTLCLNLACAAEAAGQSAAVIDVDPQASAKGWSDHRQQEAPAVISAQAARLPEVLATARKHGAGICLIDTSPHSEASALAAARAADLVVVPCRPSALDLRAISLTVDLVQLAKKPAVVILNAVPPRGGLADQAAAALKPFGLPVASVRVSQRAAFVHSLSSDSAVVEFQPDGVAAEEIRALYKYLCKHVNMASRHHANREVTR